MLFTYTDACKWQQEVMEEDRTVLYDYAFTFALAVFFAALLCPFSLSVPSGTLAPAASAFLFGILVSVVPC